MATPNQPSTSTTASEPARAAADSAPTDVETKGMDTTTVSKSMPLRTDLFGNKVGGDTDEQLITSMEVIQLTAAVLKLSIENDFVYVKCQPISGCIWTSDKHVQMYKWIADKLQQKLAANPASIPDASIFAKALISNPPPICDSGAAALISCVRKYCLEPVMRIGMTDK